MKSPVVRIYVGQRPEPFEIPKDLLLYYSPHFASHVSASESVLHLPDEEPQFFEPLLAYMRSPSTALLPRPPNLDSWSQITRCHDFISFCSKYDVSEAASIIAPHLEHLYSAGKVFLEESAAHWEFAFNRLHADNPVLRTIARFLAKMLYDRDADSREWVEEWLGTNEKAAAAVMKAYLQMTTYEMGVHYLKEDEDSYDGEDEEDAT